MRPKRAIPQEVRRAVAIAAGGVPGRTVTATCSYCYRPGRIHWPRLHNDGPPGAWVHFEGLELDHVHPELHGGEPTAENLRLACPGCNRSKGHRLDWRPKVAI